MPAPFNYSMTPQNPMPDMMQALQFGSALGQIRDQRAMAQSQAEAQAQKQAQIQAAFNAVHENPSAENYIVLSNLLPPEQAKSIREGFAVLDESTQKATLNESARIFAALEAGQPEIALNFMQQKVDAYKNSNNEQGAKDLQMLIDLAKTGEEGQKTVADMFGMNISLMTGGKEAMEGLTKFAEERRTAAAEPDAINQRLADLEYTKAQTDKIRSDIKRLDAEAAEALLKLEETKAGNIYDPKEKADAENALRKEYSQRQETFKEIENYKRIIDSAESTGIGDVALIFTYMKILDPRSVVREGEFATASNAGGVPSSIMAAYNKALGTGKIDDNVRNQIKSQSKKIYESAQEQAEKDTAFFSDIAGRRGLNVENIIYREQTPDEAQAKVDLNALRAFLINKWPKEKDKINSLSLEQMALPENYPRGLEEFKQLQGTGTQAPVVEVVEMDDL